MNTMTHTKLNIKPFQTMKTKLISTLFVLSALAVSANAKAVEVVNLLTTESGMQRISYEQLLAQGVDLSGIRHSRLGLTLNDQPVAIFSKGQDDRALQSFFGPGGFIEFYADLADDLYTAKQAFTLHVLSGREIRATRRNIASQRTQLDQTGEIATTYIQTTVVEQNNFYDFGAPSADDPWHFGQSFARRGFEGFLAFLNTNPEQRFRYNFDLADAVDGSSAHFVMEMYGLNDINTNDTNNHHYQGFINQTNSLGTSQFKGYAVDQLQGSAPVNNGQNTVSFKFEISEAAIDIIALNKLTVEYQRNTVAQDGVLQGHVDGGQLLVSELGNSLASVYRKTESGLVRIIGARLTSGGTAFNTGGIAGEYIVVGDSGFAAPEVALIQDDQDISSGSAEYLVIAHPSLMGDSLDELVRIRQARYSVKVVDVNQIYGQFGNGLPSSDAIADYIKFASANLDTRYVVLIGNDTYDYKGFIVEGGNSGSVSLIPTPYVSTPGGSITVNQTPSDASYGDLDNDGVPDLAIGRISARTETELSNVVAKINAYESSRSDYVGRILLAAGLDDAGTGVSFSSDADAFASVIPEDWSGAIRSDFRAYPSVDGVTEAQNKLLAAFNGGVSVVSYIGHSSHTSWSSMLWSSSIPNLTNVGRPAVVTQWGCWNSYYVDPQGNTMGDLLLLSSEAGAVTVLGASTLTTSEEERALGVEVNKRMYQEGKTIGEAVIEAKQALRLIGDFPAVQLGWQIIGDPAIVVNN